MHTRVCDMFGIEFPIFAFSHCRDVVAAVTNAGGLGMLGAVGHSPEGLEIDLAWIDEQTQGKPYGVDLLLPASYADTGSAVLDRDAVRQLLPPEQQAFVDDILRRYEVPQLPEELDAAPVRISVAPDRVATLLDVAFSHPIRLVASAAAAIAGAFVAMCSLGNASRGIQGIVIGAVPGRGGGCVCTAL